jgi:hypothetical protein
MSQPSLTLYWLRTALFLSASTAWAIASGAAAAERETNPASALRARYAAFYERLEQSPFLQQLEVESFEDARAAGGDIYSIVNHSIATVSEAFTSPTAWCDALILHLNVKYCHPAAHDDRIVLSVAIGKKSEQPLRSTDRFEFVYHVAASQPDYLEVELAAPKGPYGTRKYRIALEAVSLENERSFMRLHYSCTYGFVGRVAMKAYLATSGSSKVGFTMIGDPNDAQPKLVSGVRGAIERNAMRYYLAIEAYLGALASPAGDRFEQSLEQWFIASERYPRQLHEVDRDAYLAMKRNEHHRQQSIH